MIKNYLGILLIGLVVLGVIIYGFTSSGSPIKVRGMKFDSQRVSDISNLKYQVEYYYRTNNRLPATLADVESAYKGYSPVKQPIDPETKKSYDYIPGERRNYKLCGTFSLSNLNDSQKQKNNYLYFGEDFKHPQGYHCFDLTIAVPTPYPSYNYPTPTPQISKVPSL